MFSFITVPRMASQKPMLTWYSRSVPCSGGRRQPEHGTDLEYQVNIGFWDAIRGTVMKLNITRLDTCNNCAGKGVVGSPTTCPQCGGKGKITQTSGRMKFNT